MPLEGIDGKKWCLSVTYTCGRADGQGPNGICVSVAVAVVKVSAPVAAGPNEDVALSGPPVGHSLEESSGGQPPRAIHGPAIVIGAPTGNKNTHGNAVSFQEWNHFPRQA